jgi:hypothetical protein
MMPIYRTSAIDFCDIIGFTTMLVPRFMPWGYVRKILLFLDLLFAHW